MPNLGGPPDAMAHDSPELPDSSYPTVFAWAMADAL